MDIKSYRAEMNFIFRQPMDFSIILVGGHALRKSVLTVSTEHVKMIFFCTAVLTLGLLWADTCLTHLEFICCPEPDFQLCWKMTLAAINSKCLKQHLTTVSTRLGSPGLKLLLQGQKYVSRARGWTQTASCSSQYIMKAVIMAFPDLILMPPVKAKQKA